MRDPYQAVTSIYFVADSKFPESAGDYVIAVIPNLRFGVKPEVFGRGLLG